MRGVFDGKDHEVTQIVDIAARPSIASVSTLLPETTPSRVTRVGARVRLAPESCPAAATVVPGGRAVIVLARGDRGELPAEGLELRIGDRRIRLQAARLSAGESQLVNPGRVE